MSASRPFRIARLLLIAVVAIPSLYACNGGDRAYDDLDLSRVVLYRNGIGYFERTGQVEGNVLKIRARKDQINDVLKSLTVVDRGSGRALSVSMPLDPQTWANAALATLAPGRGNLAAVLDALRGTRISVTTTDESSVSGRILLVEYVEPEGEDGRPDHRISVLDGEEVEVVLLSRIAAVTFEDRELALQLHRSLDASAGEGMFQQVDVSVRLNEGSHDLLLSYVVSAPIWKPTYRIVLPAEDAGEALLQAWAVVDNTSGEDWDQVELSLTSGAPIAFRYDLHTPLTPGRPDMTATGTAKRARVAVGETTWADDEEEELAAEEPAPKEMARAEEREYKKKDKRRRSKRKRKPSPKSSAAPSGGASFDSLATGGDFGGGGRSSGVVLDELRSSTAAKAKAARVSGLTRYDLDLPVTVPEGSSTMVAILNETIEAEQIFMFQPGGAGVGFELNPYRVVRFKNSTPFALEPGPIAIYAGGSFVGEGLNQAVATKASATIPFSVEPDIQVTSKTAASSGKVNLLKVIKGVLYTESFSRWTTTYTVKAPAAETNRKILIRHNRRGSQYTFENQPEKTEDLGNAYLIPVVLEATKKEVELEVLEQTPSRSTVSIFDGAAVSILETFLAARNLDPAARKSIEPIVQIRRSMADIDRTVANLKKRQTELDQRADQTRRNLEAIKKDPAAGALRARLNKRLDQFTREGDKIGRQIVDLTSKRLEKKIELDEAVESFEFIAPSPGVGKKK